MDSLVRYESVYLVMNFDFEIKILNSSSCFKIVSYLIPDLFTQNRSGKSTLVQLLCRLFHPDPATTQIAFNGRVPLHRVARQSLRDMISYVAQRPFIFPGTIADNIRMARPDATDWEVECAAEAAGCFIFDVPSPVDADELPNSNDFAAQNDGTSGDQNATASAAAGASSLSSDIAPFAAQPALSMKGAKAAPLKPWEVEKRWYMNYWPMNVLSARFPTWLAALGNKAAPMPIADANSASCTGAIDVARTAPALAKAGAGMVGSTLKLTESIVSRESAALTGALSSHSQQEEWLNLWNAPTAFSDDFKLQQGECDGSMEGSTLPDFATIYDSITYASRLVTNAIIPFRTRLS